MNKDELSKGFTGIEINGVRFSNIKEMLIYMNKQRVRIINLENENAELKAYNEKLLDGDIEKHNKIVELQNRNGELAGQVASLNRWFGEAKGIIKYLLGFIKQEGYRTRWDINIVQAEQFLKENK